MRFHSLGPAAVLATVCLAVWMWLQTVDAADERFHSWIALRGNPADVEPAQNSGRHEQQSQPQKPGVNRARAKPLLAKFMREKLGASNQIMEGLVTEKYSLIAQGAKKLREMSDAEQWRIANDALYRQYSAEFQRVTERLEKAAADKQIDGAALSWIETTMSCIKCHKYVRAMLIADGDPHRNPFVLIRSP